ncbi:MAG: FAD-dependent oxidoreductase [Pseudomonadota bacterium]
MSEQPKLERELYPYARHSDQETREPAHHPITIVGAGPVGLALAIDLAQRGVPTLILDDNTCISTGSRAICFAKRTLEIADRLGIGQGLVDKGVQWNLGRVFVRDDEIFNFNLLAEDGHRRPAFINLQQYYLEEALVSRLRALQDEGAPVDLRGGNRVTGLSQDDQHVTLNIDTPEGPYALATDWLVACDGANSPLRDMLGLGFEGRVFEDNFLIADVRMTADFPTERWFWFNPPFNPGQSALLHKQPDDIWRIDLQLGWDIDRETETEPNCVKARVRQMLGPEAEFELEWVSIYTFQCRRMQSFRHGRALFAGDAAHQVSPFGARGANSGIQDADNLGWKLAAITKDKAPHNLLDSYNHERLQAADENILHSTRSTDFITPKSDISRVFRDAVLDLAHAHAFARPMINSGRLSQPSSYDGSALNTEDALPEGPALSRPGSPCPDAPVQDGFLLDHLTGGFSLFGTGVAPPAITGLKTLQIEPNEMIKERFLGRNEQAIYLIRPDQHIVARWSDATTDVIAAALARAKGN